MSGAAARKLGILASPAEKLLRFGKKSNSLVTAVNKVRSYTLWFYGLGREAMFVGTHLLFSRGSDREGELYIGFAFDVG